MVVRNDMLSMILQGLRVLLQEMHQRAWPTVLIVAVLLGTGYCAAPTFDIPPTSGGSGSIAENAAVGAAIITLHSTDADGDVAYFTVSEQTPDYPVFIINADDELIVPSGLDADTGLTTYYFNLRVTDGTSADYTTYILTITDVNDEAPLFTQTTYTSSVVEGAPVGTVLTTVSATDPDLNKQAISYSILGAQTFFQIDSSSGVIIVSGSFNLDPSNVMLTIAASDGQLTGTALLFVQILAVTSGIDYTTDFADVPVTTGETRGTDDKTAFTDMPSNTGVIAGVASGGLAVVIVGVVVTIVLYKRRRITKPQTQHETSVQHDANDKEATLTGSDNTAHLYDYADVVMHDLPKDGATYGPTKRDVTSSTTSMYDDVTTTGLYVGLITPEAQSDYSVLFEKRKE